MIFTCSFDLELQSKSAMETKYHEYMHPLLQAMVQDAALSSIKVHHALINNNAGSVSNSVDFIFPDFAAFSKFQGTYSMYFVSLPQYWKNWRSTLYTVSASDQVKGYPAPALEVTDKQVFFYTISLHYSPKAAAAADAQATALVGKIRAIPGVLAVALARDAHAMGSDAARRLIVDVESWDAVSAFYADAAVARFIADGTDGGGWASYSTDLALTAPPIPKEVIAGKQQ